MKEIAIIVGFAAFTALPPMIAGLSAPPPALTEPGGASNANGDLPVLRGAICLSRPVRKVSGGADAALFPRPTSAGQVTE